MAITLLKPFNLDSTGNYTFNTLTANIKTDSLQYANGAPYTLGGAVAGSNTQVQFNDGNSFGGNANFTFDKTTSKLTVTYIAGDGSNISNIAGANVTGIVANANIANTAYSVSGANVSGEVANAAYANIAGTANSVSGANVSGQVGNATVAGTVYTNAQPNITSVGTLTSLTVSGNTDLGNISNVKITGGSNNFVLKTDGLGNLSWVAQPNISGYATESYVGNAIANLVNSAPTVLDTLGELSNALGNDASFSTSVTNSLANKLNTSDFNTTANNWGANYLTNYSGNLKASNANLGNAVSANFFIGNGSLLTGLPAGYTNSDVANYLPTHTGNISANNLTVTNTFTAGTITTSGSGGNISGANVISANSFTATGNITAGNANLGNAVTANFFIGNGSLLTGLPAGYTDNNVANYLPNYAGNISANNLTVTNTFTAGSITTSGSGGNISGANVIIANLFQGNANSLSNIPGANVTGFVPNANVANTAYNVSGANVSGQVANAIVAGTVYTNAQPNITSVGTLSSLGVTGNVSANFFIGNGSQLTGLPASYTDANVANYLPNYTGNVSANYFIGNGSSLTNITGGNVTGFVPNANVANTAFSVSGANVSGEVANANFASYSNVAYNVSGSNVSGQVGNATVAGTVYTNAQPNITSVGNLTSLTVNGVSNLGNIGNVKITGGGNGHILTTDGNGNLTWSSSAGTTVGDTYFDSFAANGVQTAFTLTQTPAGKKYISVFIDSTYQNDDAYTLAGNVVTFSSAPLSNSVIEIRTINPGTITSATTSGTVTTNAQPNITSLGNLTSLTMSGNIIPSVSNTYSLGNATNRFKDIYLQGNTIYLGDRSLSADDVLPFDLTIQPEVLTINADVSGPGNDIMWLWTWTQSSLPYARTTITNQQQIQVPLYKQGTYQVNNFANEVHGNQDQRHLLYLKWVDGAGLDNLVSWANNVGNVTHSHPNINGGANTTVQRINVSVPATITIPTLNLPSNVVYNVAANGSSAYSITGSGVGLNRNIGPLYRGATYTFNLDSSLANHPFYITTDNGTGFVAGQYVGEYTTGITGSRGNGQAGYNTLTWTIANNAPDTLFYQCGNHSPMRGAITIKNLAVETNINGNYVLYFQHMKEGHKTPVEIRPIPAMVNQMCLVYDATTGQFVPQDMATYVENTPSFKNKIQEVAGTATLVAPDGVAVVPTVLVIEDVSYLPLVDNNDGDIAFDAYTDTIYVWESNAWRNTKPNLSSYATQTFVNNAVANLVNSAPAVLDTLSELSNALGNDASFSSTITNSLANKLNTNAFNTTANTWISNVANLSVSGNVTLTGSTINLGSVSNLRIAGGTANYVLTTDGSGNLSWAAQTGGGGASATAYISMSMAGLVTSPYVGTTRFYPPKNVTVSKVHAHVSVAPSAGAFTFLVKKNGVSIGQTFSIAQNTNVLTPVTVNVSLTTTDYLTLDITGASATDLFVRLEYTAA